MVWGGGWGMTRMGRWRRRSRAAGSGSGDGGASMMWDEKVSSEDAPRCCPACLNLLRRNSLTRVLHCCAHIQPVQIDGIAQVSDTRACPRGSPCGPWAPWGVRCLGDCAWQGGAAANRKAKTADILPVAPPAGGWTRPSLWPARGTRQRGRNQTRRGEPHGAHRAPPVPSPPLPLGGLGAAALYRRHPGEPPSPTWSFWGGGAGVVRLLAPSPPDGGVAIRRASFWPTPPPPRSFLPRLPLP